ncbi:MAG TPA: patatin-like phospholipase family protein [Steroidobacteraceae bacterium]|nr:patatin-like phospholipase family protein [Steroidobacteraceae bacterium]
MNRDLRTPGPKLTRHLALAMGWLLLAFAAVAFGADAAPAPTDTSSAPAPGHRLRIGLVLSGGGARGAAHIGVLEVLDQLHIPIDAIAGTSMGAVVGGLYASGLSATQIATVANSLNWQDAFHDRPPRDELTYRRKEEDESFLVNFPVGVRDWAFQLPKGLIKGQSLEMLLRRLTLPVATIGSFDDLPTRFRAVATDLASGDPVVMKSGDLASAMRASLSAPGLFEPVEREGKVLGDGGLADNLPIDVARAMNVDVLIVVDVGAPLFTRDRLGSATTIANQMLSILIRRDATRQLQTLAKSDILISPTMGNLSSFDFGIVPKAMAAGSKAAQEVSERLRQLALSPDDYARYVADRDAMRRGLPHIDYVKVNPTSEPYVAALNGMFAPFAGLPLDPKALERTIDEYYGRGKLESLDYQVLTDGDQHGLLITAQPNSWGPDFVRFGLGLQDDFQGNATYNIGARLVMGDITRTGGEWVWDLEAGSSPHIYTELYLPFEQTSAYFIDPHTEFDDINTPLVNSEQNHLAELRVHTFRTGLDLGKELENIGELRFGVYHEQGGTSVLIGDVPLPPVTETFNANGYFARFSLDQLDDVRFPHNGQLASVEWNSERYEVGNDVPFDRLSVNYLTAGTFGRETAMFWISGGATFNQTNPLDVRTQYPLGGLFNLSGIAADSLAGPQYAIARVLLYRKIGKGGDGPFDFPTYVGVSFEAGNVYEKLGDINWGNSRKDASIFLGIDTFLGPIYLATGYEEHGRQAFYLFLGRTFGNGSTSNGNGQTID